MNDEFEKFKENSDKMAVELDLEYVATYSSTPNDIMIAYANIDTGKMILVQCLLEVSPDALEDLKKLGEVLEDEKR